MDRSLRRANRTHGGCGSEKNGCQPACKPGSVWRIAPPRRPFIWDGHCWPPRATNPGGGPGNGPGAAGSPRSPGHPYLVLLPVGFALPLLLPVARCALTAPFHPCPAGPGEPPSAVCFLWHFPWGRPRRPLAATVFPWSPDFPLPVPVRHKARSPAAAVRPAGISE